MTCLLRYRPLAYLSAIVLRDRLRPERSPKQKRGPALSNRRLWRAERRRASRQDACHYGQRFSARHSPRLEGKKSKPRTRCVAVTRAHACPILVMPGLVPGIPEHRASNSIQGPWIAGSGPAMTERSSRANPLVGRRDSATIKRGMRGRRSGR